ncbi:MAG: hypothetical protein LBC02_03255 [Planctomycetaceae bacterium]|jgi:hypothetical protein|nr:hypothetical protein [Planctomycetaceae bacterium]
MIEINDIREIDVLWGPDLDEYNDNADISVTLNDGRRCWGQIFTIANIIKLMNKYCVTGEHNPDYFWVRNLIITTHLTRDVVTNTIHDLIKQEHFEETFCFIENEHE